MPATPEHHHHGHGGGGGAASFLSRISITRRTQVVSMDVNHEQEPEHEHHHHHHLFQQNVAHRFSNILPSSSVTGSSSSSSNNGSLLLLSISWIRKLLDSFSSCEAEFKAVLMDSSHQNGTTSKVLFDHRRLVHDLLDRYVKALDICNAVSHGVESIRGLQKLGHIVVLALESRPVGEGQNFRAKKALLSLRKAINSDEKEAVAIHKLRQRTWSFNHHGNVATFPASPPPRGNKERSSIVTSRTISSCGVPKNWSVTKQIQAMTSTLVVPRSNSDSSSSPPGLASPVYAMSCVTVFVMWVLAAAIPCQDRNGLAAHLPVPKNSGWAHGMLVLQEKISEEWRKKEKKGSCGLMQEIQKMDAVTTKLVEFTDSYRFPVDDVNEEDEFVTQVGELRDICERMEQGLVSLQSQIRQVFHQIVKSRTEILALLDHAAKSVAPAT